jgi:hypothetical protein
MKNEMWDLKVASMKMEVFWDVSARSLVETVRRFRDDLNSLDDSGSKHIWNVGQFLRYDTT